MAILFKNSLPAFRNNTLQIIPLAGSANDCICCGDEPPCPERKICLDSENNPIFPVKVNSFYIDVTGIPNTMTAQMRYYFISYSNGGPGCRCNVYEEIEVELEYELTGFAALNRRYEQSMIEYPFGGDSCDNVCKPCLWTIQSVRVPITGQLTGRKYFKDENSCFPEEDIETEDFIDEELCASAVVDVIFNATTQKYEASIRIIGGSFGPTPRISPTPPGLTFIDLQRECFYPAHPNSAIIGDFDWLGYNATGTNLCIEDEQTWDDMVSAFSYRCEGTGIDEDITKNTWPDCEYADEQTTTSEVGDPELEGGCVITTTIEAEFYRQGLEGFSARLVIA